jgi:uncharacterized protein YecT (DUF1311 family)
MNKKRDLIAEIEEIRSRNRFAYPITIPSRMLALVAAFRTPNLDAELLRYVPIGIVACFEGFFRAGVKELIDAGEPFAGRASGIRQSQELRLDLELLRAIHGRRVTIGELISHIVSMNSVEQIDAIFSTLLGDSFLTKVRGAHSRWAVEVQGNSPTPIIANFELTLERLREVFRLRHIYAHELAESESSSADGLGEMLEISVGFLNAAAEVFGALLQPGAPLTQADMNERAAAAAAEAEQELKIVLDRLRRRLDTTRQEKLSESQLAWDTFCVRQAEFLASEYAGGSLRPTVYASSKQATTRRRIEELEGALAELLDGRYAHDDESP